MSIKELRIQGGAIWYGIMLDDEYDALMPDYFPIRHPSQDRAEVERTLWLSGNPRYIPADIWTAQILKSKKLLDQTTRAEFSGAIYRFRTVAGDGT